MIANLIIVLLMTVNFAPYSNLSVSVLITSLTLSTAKELGWFTKSLQPTFLYEFLHVLAIFVILF
jgi:hypothetical protein